MSEWEAVGGVTNRVSKCELSGEDVPDFAVAAKVILVTNGADTAYQSTSDVKSRCNALSRAWPWCVCVDEDLRVIGTDEDMIPPLSCFLLFAAIDTDVYISIWVHRWVKGTYVQA